MSPRPRMGGLRWPDGPAPDAAIAGLRAALGPDARILVLDRPAGWRTRVLGPHAPSAPPPSATAPTANRPHAPSAPPPSATTPTTDVPPWLAVGPPATGRSAPGFAPASGGPASVHDADPDVLPASADAPGAWAVATAHGDTLTLARDPIGHRSLFWATPRPGAVVFASTLAGVLGSGLVRRALHGDAVAAYLAYAYVPGTRTLVRDVYALDAGHQLIVDASGAHVTRAWALPDGPPSPAPEDTLRDTLRDTLEAVLRDHLPPPGAAYGATLSGGIDSSLVLALARRLHDGPARCFSVTFGPPHADELAWSGLVAAHLGVPQQTVLVRPEDVRARFDATVGALSEPNGDPLTVPNLLLFEAAAAHADVLLNGEGGDPTFGGPKNAPMLLAELLEGGDERGAAYLRAHQRLYDELPTLLDAGLDPAGAPARLAAELEPQLAGRGLLDALMAINVSFKGAWHILPKVDHLGAVHGVRPRSPLFDPRLVALSFAVPGPLKRRGSVEKHLLKEAVRDLLPDVIVDRPKSGMMVPVEAWFAGPLRTWARERLLDSGTLTGILRRDAIEDLLAGRRLGLRPRRGVKIWQLLTLEAWIRLVVGP